MATKTKKPARETISQDKFEEAVKRYSENSANCAKIISASEAKITAETKARHEKLGDMPKQIAEDEATIMQYVEDNREQLCGDSKTYDAGMNVTVSFRLGKQGLVYNEGVKAEDLVKALVKKSLVSYLKTTTTLKAAVILSNHAGDTKLKNTLDAVGVSVEQTESVSVKWEVK